MKLMCFECCEEVNVTRRSRVASLTFHQKPFHFTEEYYECDQCKNDVHDDELYDLNLRKSIEFFQHRQNMLTAYDFKYIRETIYGCSVRTFATLIGCSPATISKYENGALQSKQHDLQIKSLLHPKNMVNLLHASMDELKPAELQKLEERLSFLLEAVRIEELLKGLNAELTLPSLDFEMDTHNYSAMCAETVANYFIMKGYDTLEKEGHDARISNLKLQKMIYFAEGWYSAITGQSLILEDFEAWRHGPVIKEIYHQYKEYGYHPIPPIENADESLVQPSHVPFLDWVWDTYCHFDSKMLEDISHQESPWRNARIGLDPNERSNRIIPKADIHAYYQNVHEGLRILKSIRPL